LTVELTPESTGFRVTDQSNSYVASVQAGYDLFLLARGGSGEDGGIGGDGKTGTSGHRGMDATQYSEATVSRSSSSGFAKDGLTEHSSLVGLVAQEESKSILWNSRAVLFQHSNTDRAIVAGTDLMVLMPAEEELSRSV